MKSPVMDEKEAAAVAAEIKLLEHMVIEKYGLGKGNRKQRRAANARLRKDAKMVLAGSRQGAEHGRQAVLETLARHPTE